MSLDNLISKAEHLFQKNKHKESLHEYLSAYNKSKELNKKNKKIKCLKRIISLSAINRLSQEILPKRSVSWLIKFKDVEFSKKLIEYGSYSIVRSGYLQINNEKIECAIKQLDMNKTTEEEFIHEVQLMYECKHKNVLKIYGCYWRKICDNGYVLNNGNIIMELCSKGSLDRVIKKKLTDKQKLNYIYQIANGMHYLHTIRNIVHIDLKLENILVDSRDIIKICDFGAAKHIKTFVHKLIGTAEYVAPEVLGKKNPNPKLLDVYSFGILSWAIWAQKKPFSDLYKENLDIPIVKVVYIIKNSTRPNLKKIKKAPKKLKNLIKACWNKNPKKRPQSFEAILNILNKIF